jgi:hypothetical protein
MNMNAFLSNIISNPFVWSKQIIEHLIRETTLAARVAQNISKCIMNKTNLLDTLHLKSSWPNPKGIEVVHVEHHI